MSLSQKQIILVTGKGGVGKSTVAATIAYGEAQKGRKTLLVELGSESFYKPFFNLETISYEPQEISPKLFVAIWDVEHCLREYVLHFLRVQSLYRIFFENRIMRTFINAAPAISELAILGKVTSNYRHHGPPLPYDVVVVDAYATGHFLALLRAPKGLSEAVRSGPFGEQSASIMNALLNPDVSGYVIVTLPELLPAVESQELWGNLKSEFGIEAEVICNRVLDISVPDENLAKLSEKKELTFTRTFLGYLKYISRRQKASLEKISAIGPRVTQVHQSLKNLKGLDLVRELKEDLS